jgi:hypothetical protein
VRPLQPTKGEQAHTPKEDARTSRGDSRHEFAGRSAVAARFARGGGSSARYSRHQIATKIERTELSSNVDVSGLSVSSFAHFGCEMKRASNASSISAASSCRIRFVERDGVVGVERGATSREIDRGPDRELRHVVALGDAVQAFRRS